MKTATLCILTLSLALAADAATITLSSLPSTGTVDTNDDVIINSTNAGTGTWTTSRSRLANVIKGALPLIQVTPSMLAGTVTQAIQFQVTNTANLASTNFNGSLSTNLYVKLAMNGSTAFPLPVMGFNTYYAGGQLLTSSNRIAYQAAFMISNHLDTLGYRYLVLDDGWACSTRDVNGNLVANTNLAVSDAPVAFPGGSLKPLADYLHARGLKLGVYSELGGASMSSGNYQPTSKDHWEQDANLFASWGIDYVKMDGAWDYGTDSNIGGQEYYHRRMYNALQATGRAIYYEANVMHHDFPSWCTEFPNSTRDPNNGGDLTSFSTLCLWIDEDLGRHDRYSKGHWPYLDAMGAGNIDALGLTEERAHFGMAALFSSPLILSSMEPPRLQIYTNAEVISIDQDPMGIMASKTWSNALCEVWSKPLSGTQARAVGLMNRNTTAQNITCYWTNIGIWPGVATVRDLWANADLGVYTNSFTASVPEHGVTLLKITPGYALVTTNVAISGWQFTVENGRIVGLAPYVWDSDASAFLTASGYTITNGTVQNAINDLTKAAKANGWWTLCDAIYPMIGSSLTGTKYNLKNPATYTLAENGTGLTYDANGAWSSGASGLLGPVASTLSIGAQNNIHLFVYWGSSGAGGNGNPTLAGAGTSGGSSQRLMINFIGNTQLLGLPGTADGGDHYGAVSADIRGPMITSSHGTATSVNYFGFGSSVTYAGSTQTTYALPACGIALFTIDFTSGGVDMGTYWPSIGNMRGATIGGYIDPVTMWPTFQADWNAYEAALGRKVP